MKVNQISNIMNPLVLFDYVYYSVANFYSYVLDVDEQKRAVGVGVLSMFQMFNCLTLYSYLKLERYINVDITRMIVPVALVLLGLNFIRYYKIVNFNMLKNKWSEDKMHIRLMKITLTVCYIVLTFMLLGIVPG